MDAVKYSFSHKMNDWNAVCKELTEHKCRSNILFSVKGSLKYRAQEPIFSEWLHWE